MPDEPKPSDPVLCRNCGRRVARYDEPEAVRPSGLCEDCYHCRLALAGFFACGVTMRGGACDPAAAVSMADDYLVALRRPFDRK